MAGYQPTYIRKMETGLVQSRQEFILPNDAYPILQNAFLFRERIKRKQGYKLLGQLRRKFTATSIGNSTAAVWNFNLYTTVAPPIIETNAQIEVGSLSIIVGVVIFTDNSDGTLTSVTAGNSGTINYSTGAISLTHTSGVAASTATFNYFPGLPVMGLRKRETASLNSEELIAFDTTYAYKYVSGFEEFIPGTTWTGSDSQFFWSTNWYVDTGNTKIFWVTNFNSGAGGDLIRYTNGVNWESFEPQINSTPEYLEQCRCLVPFRGRLLAFNTWEGTNLANAIQFPQRIRWSAIGTPFTVSASIGVNVNANGWRDDLVGQGGFLDIPTSQNIVSVGFVRDNLVIYCERSTWQLRYTGRSIAPFQIEKVNSELGSESTFSAIQFDTSLVGVGDKGVVECNSFKSERIDIKIPDLVFEFNNEDDGVQRIHGIRDFQQRLAFWTYPLSSTNAKFPNRRLIYNYENDSWAIFTDSLTTLGTFQASSDLTWESEGNTTWDEANFTWDVRPALFPSIIGGNQQGFIEYLDNQTSSEESLYITGILGSTVDATTIITSPDHNLETGFVISIKNLVSTDPYYSLNDGIYGVDVIDSDTFQIFSYDSSSGGTQDFTVPVIISSISSTLGGGRIYIRDNFIIKSKKFNFLDEGQNIQMGYVDILTNATDEGEFSLNVYLDYNNNSPINIKPQNQDPNTENPDTFFNSVVPTSRQGGIEGEKYWARVFCPVRGNFITILWTLSNAQMISAAQESDVQIDSQILWLRRAGKQLPIGL